LPFFSHATEANVVCFMNLSAPPLLLTAHSIGHLGVPVQSFPSRPVIDDQCYRATPLPVRVDEVR
jgi:hypothetical protein